MNIIINGSEIDVPDSKCGSGLTTRSYETLVQLAGEAGTPTVKYSGSRSGLLSPGMDLTLEPGMRLTIIHTGNA